MGVDWVDIANGGKSLHIVFGNIGDVMFKGFQEGEKFWGPTRNM